MALGMYFAAEKFPAEAYDEAIKRLDDAGAGAPDGRLYHFAWVVDDNIRVFDVWESEAKFQAFGETLLPILGALGTDPGQPEVYQIHNVIKG
jgi:hypothetical protein